MLGDNGCHDIVLGRSIAQHHNVLVDRSIDNHDHTDVFLNHGHNCPVAGDRCGAGW
jgi:hypothetical protein